MANEMQGTQFKMYQTMVNDYKAFAHQVLTVTTSSQALTVPANTKYCFIQVESTNTVDAIRFWADGSTPTSTVGIFRGNGDCLDIIDAENVKNFRCIKGAGGGNTTLNIQYYY